MLNVRVKKALLTILTACLTVLMMVGAVLGFTPTTLSVKAAAGNYVKVTSAPADWSGTYLIVYEESKTDGRAFNGNLTSLDVVKNTVAVTISNGEIANTDTLENATFTIAKNGNNYTVQSKSGYYIGRDSTKNGLDSSKSTKYNNTITMTDGNPIIKGSGGYSLQFNKTSGQERFRYFGSNQQALALYKLEESVACEHKDTFTYTYSESDEHEKVSTCTACGRTTTEIVDCSYGDEITVPATEEATGRIYKVCGDCKHEKIIQELPKINATKYTLSFSVPKEVPSVASVEVAEGYTCVLESAANYNDYTFAGWAAATLDEVTTTAPTLYKAGDEYTMGDAHTTLYAVYSYSVYSGSENFEKVTSNQEDWSGTYLIGYQYSDTEILLFNGKDAVNGHEEATVEGNVITATSDIEKLAVTIESMSGGYSIYFEGAGYISGDSGSNKLYFSNTASANTISLNDKEFAEIYSGRYLEFNAASNQMRFRYYTKGSQGAIQLYKLVETATIYYTTNLECEHSFTETEIKATCTEEGGIRKTCAYCGHEEFVKTADALGHNFEITETIAGTCQAKEVINYTCSRCPATKTEDGELGDHDYVDGICSVCEFVDPLSVDYSGYYYFTFTRADEEVAMYVNNSWSNDRYMAYDDKPTTELSNYLFRVVRNEDGTYNVYEGLSDKLFANGTENVVIVKNEEYYNIYNAEKKYFALHSNTDYDYVKFYAGFIFNITFVEYTEIVSANLTVGETLTMNYKVAMDDSFADAKMTFTMAGNTTTVAGVPEGNVYVYSLQIAPQHMGEEIKAELKKLDGTVLASKESYSVKAYAEYQLANSTNDTLKQLVVDMLYYGKAAQEYKNYKTNELVTEFLADITGAPTQNTAAPTTTDFELVNELAAGSTYPAYFVGAGVRFGADNKIFVELSTVENVTLEVNGVEVELNGTTYYTDGLKATQFGDTFTFELYCDGVLMQTLTYSVNAYAYQFAGGNDAMANLAIALYNYGQSAGNYVA